MAEIVQLQKNGVNQYPITTPDAVIDKNGKSLEDRFEEISQSSGSYDDTEIRDELSRLEKDKADKTELTELSLEVSGLSERIENLPTAKSEVFEAVYKQTTFDEIVAARNEGKVVICNNAQIAYILTFLTNSAAYFTSHYSGYVYQLICNKSGVWQSSSQNISHELKQLDNGNVQITIVDKTAEVATPQYVENAIQQSGGGGGMTTPSGDPMHNAYVEAGAEYNDTGADIEKQGMFDYTITHKAGHWYLNEVGDITTAEMRRIYSVWRKVAGWATYYGNNWNIRTNLPFLSITPFSVLSSSTKVGLTQVFLSNQNIVSARVWGTIASHEISECFTYCYQLKTIVGELTAKTYGASTFNNCISLENLKVKSLSSAIRFVNSSKLSYSSIRYMIANSATTAAITLTLHATALANAETAYLEDTTQDHTTYPTLSDWALSKNIQIATA